MRVTIATLSLCIPALAGCGGDNEVTSDIDMFCATARDQTHLIMTPPMSTQAEFDQTLAFYKLMGKLAPLQIATEWNQLVAAIETAATLQPGNPESEQLVAMTAYAVEGPAYDVATFLQRFCGVTIPITTIVPRGEQPSSVTQVPDAATTTDSTDNADANG